MEIFQSAIKLSVYLDCFKLRHPSVRLCLQKVIATTAADILHDQNYFPFSLYCIVQLTNIRVVKSLHYSYLSPNGFLPLEVLYFFFEIDFEGYLMVSPPISTHIRYSVCARPYLLPNDIVIHWVVLRIYDFFFTPIIPLSIWTLLNALSLYHSTTFIHRDS